MGSNNFEGEWKTSNYIELSFNFMLLRVSCNHFRAVNGQIQRYQGLTVDLKSDNTVNSSRTSSTNSLILLTAVLNVAPDRQFLQSFSSRGDP